MPTSLENITTIEYLQDHATELVESVSGSDEPLFITVAGQPKAVLMDYEQFEEYKKYRQGVLLLSVLNERSKEIDSGNVVPYEEAFQRIREKILARKPS